MHSTLEHCLYGFPSGFVQRVLSIPILSSQVVTLCREHHLSLGLIYVYNKGLDDFITPLDHLMMLLANEKAEEQDSSYPLFRRNLGYKVPKASPTL